MEDKETVHAFNFYKEFYDTNRIRVLQYDNLRWHYNKMIDDTLGEDYYNMGADVYQVDKLCCEDITKLVNGSLCTKIKKLMNRLKNAWIKYNKRRDYR